MPADSARSRFCCAGCEAVYGLLYEQGLDRYYALADEVAPVPERPRERSFAWIDPILARAMQSQGPVCDVDLDVQGIHCAACVWLMNELFRRQGGGSEITVNPALGKVRLRWQREGSFDLQRYLQSVESFGYLFGPSRKRAERAASDLPIRLGICAAITMNVMIFSISFYFGLTPADGELFGLFTKLSVALSAVTVLVGGWPFFKAAIAGLRRGVLHLDLPIAIGIVLVFATSVLQARSGRGDLAYFDTLNTFVTLMLVGRWLQQREVDRNRRFLLEDDGAEGLFVRRIEDGRISTIAAAKVCAGDELLISPGDLAPVDGELLDASARVSTAWITGESDVREVVAGERLPAGACNEGRSAVRMRAATGFEDSPLVALLRQSRPGSQAPVFARFWSRLSRVWVLGVLTIAAVGVLAWWNAGPERALEIAAALLVVTCPCAIGIATPLAYELVQSRLRRAGVFVRSADLLDRLPRVKKVLFDKTGTITLGRLELVDDAPVFALDPRVRDVAYDMVARSNHPVSRCLSRALEQAGARFSEFADVHEIPGKGLELVRGGERWRLGSEEWATDLRPEPDLFQTEPVEGGSDGQGAPRQARHEGGSARSEGGSAGLGGGSVGPDRGTTVLAREGTELARFSVRESVRPDAQREIRALSDAGYQVWLISGDIASKVARMAGALGIPGERALAAQRPEDKAAAVARIDQADTLFLGDGVNDSLAFERALCAGTPAVDRPMMPGKADFFLLGEGLAGVRVALEQAQRLRATVRKLLVLALAYNAVAIATCLAGLMTPLRAAVAMPASSLSVIALAVVTLSGRRDARRTATAARAPAAGPDLAKRRSAA